MRSVIGRNCCYMMLFLMFIFSVVACSTNTDNDAISNLSQVERMHFKQYVVYGRQLYTQHCSNCHQEDGSGLGRVIPPLAAADFMLQDIGRTVCIVKNGLEGDITVNGENYNQKMPAFNQLTDLEIAQITTYILNTWGNKKGYVPVNEVSKYLNNCKF